MEAAWPDRRLLDLLGVQVPIVQAPMANAQDAALAIAVSEAGGLGSVPCAYLDAEAMRRELAAFRAATTGPVNVNFFCHAVAPPSAPAEARWLERLAAYDTELGVDRASQAARPELPPFDAAGCAVVEELRPEVVSFHFGLPDESLLTRVRDTGALVLATATTVAEARVLAERGCAAIIAQGAEAGGHRGLFLSADLNTQVGTMALVPQVVDAVDVPVIAAGGIADGRGIAAAFMLGASGVQIGTGYLLCPEARISSLHRAALQSPAAAATALTNVLTGRPARGIVNRAMRELGPIAGDAPPFPRATGSMLPLRLAAEKIGDDSFSTLWSGQAAALASGLPAGELTRRLAADALERLG